MCLKEKRSQGELGGGLGVRRGHLTWWLQIMGDLPARTLHQTGTIRHGGHMGWLGTWNEASSNWDVLQVQKNTLNYEGLEKLGGGKAMQYDLLIIFILIICWNDIFISNILGEVIGYIRSNKMLLKVVSTIFCFFTFFLVWLLDTFQLHMWLISYFYWTLSG